MTKYHRESSFDKCYINSTPTLAVIFLDCVSTVVCVLFINCESCPFPTLLGYAARHSKLFRLMVSYRPSCPMVPWPGVSVDMSQHTGRHRIMGSSRKAALVVTVLEAG